MKMLRCVTIMAVALFISSTGVFGQNSRDYKKTYKFTPGDELVVRVNPGNVTISTWDKNEVEITVDGIERENFDNLEITESSGKLRIEFDNDWGWSDDIDLKIKTPEKVDINIKTTGGEIEIKDKITGTVILNSAGGDLTTGDILGDADFSTSGGDVTTGSIEGDYLVSTMGGNIEAVNLKGKIAKLKTMGGDIRVKNIKAELTLQTYGGEIEVGMLEGRGDLTTYGGNIEVESSKKGLKLNTYGGNINVGTSEDYVEAKTAGGSIIIKKAVGHVRAKTNAGNIKVTLYPQGSESSVLSTNSGEIELYIPSTAKVSIEAEIDVHGWWESKQNTYAIDSDFESKSYDKNDKRSEIRAEYEINGGGQKITLKAVNSGISIKKIK